MQTTEDKYKNGKLSAHELPEYDEELLNQRFPESQTGCGHDDPDGEHPYTFSNSDH